MGWTKLLLAVALFNGASLSYAAVRSASGQNLQFDAQSDGQIDAVIENGKFGIGVTNPSANLQVAGVSLLDEVKATSVVMPFQTVSDNLNTLGQESLVFADSSSKSISIELPDPALNTGKLYHIKKSSPENQVFIHSNGNLIDKITQSSLIDLGHVKFVSNGSEWMTLNQYNFNTSFSSNLISWFPFDEPNTNNSLDITENGLMATRSNYANAAEGWIEGVSGNAVSLDGTDDEIQVATNSLFDSVTDISITFWLKLNTLENATVLGITNNIGNAGGGSAGGGGIGISYNSAGNQTKCVSRIAESPYTVTYNPRVSSGVVSLDTWFFVSYSYDADGSIQIGMDSSFATATAIGQNIIDGFALTTGGFHGAIDDLRIYNKALSQTEIEQLKESYPTP